MGVCSEGKHRTVVICKLEVKARGEAGRKSPVQRSRRRRLQKRDPHICSKEAETQRHELQRKSGGIFKAGRVKEGSISLLVLNNKAKRPSPLLSVTLAQRTQC